MATKSTSRWADSEDDMAFEAKLKREKKEKRRMKAENVAKAVAKVPVEKISAPQALSQHSTSQDENERPWKRRRVTPEGPASVTTPAPPEIEGSAPLLRFTAGQWRKSRSVENYDKLNDIEEGTYGWVSRARDKDTGKVVALKRLKIEPNDRNGLPVTGLREIQVLRDCQHRNIVNLEEVVVNDDTSRIDNVFLVLEFVEHDLKSILEDMPEPFLPSEVKRLLLQLVSGVEYLHSKWILHRDLKTSNLLLNNRGQLKIADFGMARYVGDPAPKLTQLVVTLWYRAPELLLGTKTYGKAVDMWSLGCVFGELLTRLPLLQGTNEVDQVTKIFELCGVPTEEKWPGFRRLPNARSLRFPKTPLATGSVIRSKFPFLTNAGCRLLNDLLALDPEQRPSAKDVLQHEYFSQDPKPKQESMFPTFPSKAGQERRRRQEPHAPVRGQAIELGDIDLSGMFEGREKEERGGGFTLRMV